jgi:multimeric flavodoxin WrbA
VKLLVLYGSSRPRGNSEMLTERIVKDIPHTAIYLRDKHISPIEDKRHHPEGFQPVDDDHDDVVRQLLAHDVLLFVTPLYWYGLSGLMKTFIDRWSQSLRDKRFSFKDGLRGKQTYLIVVGGDQPRLKALPLVQQFQYICDFVGLDFRGYIIGEANQPGDILQDERALFEAERLRDHLKASVLK